MPWSRTADRQRRDCPTLLTVKRQSLHSASKPLWIVPDRKQFRARSIKIALATGPGFLYDGFGRESCAPELTHGGDIRSASPHTGAHVLRNLLIFSSSRFRFFSALSMASMIASAVTVFVYECPAHLLFATPGDANSQGTSRIGRRWRCSSLAVLQPRALRGQIVRGHRRFAQRCRFL